MPPPRPAGPTAAGAGQPGPQRANTARGLRAALQAAGARHVDRRWVHWPKLLAHDFGPTEGNMG